MTSRLRRAVVRVRHSRPVGLARYHLYRDLLLSWPRRRECNICGWRGRRFLTYLPHRFVLCPQCGSQVRHRLIAAGLELHAVLEHLSRQSRVLHISPEYCLQLVLRPGSRAYVRGDLLTAECDVRQDATRLPFAAGVFDLVVASDVLEHIPDDRAALAEIRRVLRLGGIAILTVPQSDLDEPTVEDPSVVTDAQRTARYGQPDHVRNYGSDFPVRIADAGFDVIKVDSHDFAAEEVARHVLRPPVPVPSAYGWNHRRVYFAVRR